VRRFVFGEDGVAQVLLRPLPLGLVAAYVPRGPLVANADVTAAIVALRDALKGERCTSLLCDPEVPADALTPDALVSARIAAAPVHVQPTRTLLMDLSLDPEAMLAAMRKKTRQYIRKAERAGVVTEETADVGRFYDVLRRVADRERFGIHDLAYFERLRDAFGERAHFQIATVGKDDAGALLVVRMADRAWELFGGWSGHHSEERPFYLLKWRSFMRMKELGVTRYDMWGLTERGGDADDALAGVENFKLGFGGEVVSWIGALETPVTPGLFPLWQLVGRRRLAGA